MSDLVGEELIEALRCPETGRKLRLATGEELAGFQKMMEEKALRKPCGETLDGPLEGALLTEDRRRLYPIREGFPVILIAESVILDQG